ncbi:MAG: transglutaminase domain-containing protein, partial [Candidatus Odinarchaeota archaeon]
PSDSAFTVANKIRAYLQNQFSFPMSADEYNPAPDGTDIVEWFCETEQGVWSDFASAFCAFSRCFGIASRFVDGFNSNGIEKITDYDMGQEGFAIKYKNLYNWAEIYIPTSTSGEGKWVQFDIIFESYGGGNPLVRSEYNISVTTDQFSYIRPDTATITATVSSNTAPLDGLTITFEDYTTGQTLGQDVTDIYGTASIQVDFNTSYTVGPHLIEASYDLSHVGYNVTEIAGNLSIMLTDVNPGQINISDAQPDITNVVGYVYDPLNNNTVEGPELDIILFENGTSTEVLNAFTPSSINTTTNGIFTNFLNINHNDDGYFEVRADFNGDWVINTPLGPSPYTTSNVTNSISNRMELNITKELDVLFYINGTESNDPNNPHATRYQTLNLTARVFSVTSGPYPNREVFFYDYSRGDFYLGSAMTDSNGYASINYLVGAYCRAGPNLLYARLGSQKNYSYFILNATPTINIISGPNPQVINRSGAVNTQFNILGEIYDSTNNSLPISYSEITLIMRKDGFDNSSYLEPSESYPYQTDSSGTFDLTFGIQDNTPPGNYTLRLDFNGTIDLSMYPYSYQFNLPILSNSTSFTKELKIEAEPSLYFYLDGTPSDDYNNPRINRYEDLNLTAFVHTLGIPISDGKKVEFYDDTQGISIGNATTINGNATILYNMDDTITAGPHLIYARWNNLYNYSYFILDAPINVSLNLCPIPNAINRSGSIDRYFTITGSLIDVENDNPIKYGQINVIMKDGATDVSSYLNLTSGSLQLGTSGDIDLIYSVREDTPAKNYTLEVEFDAVFDYTSSNYPHYFNLNYITNLTNTTSCFNRLRVNDPDNISIYLFIEGNPTLPFYDNFNPPEIYYEDESINFEVIIRQGFFVGTGSVTLTDVYTSTLIASNASVNGYWAFSVSTTGWHAGLHQIKVEWGSYESFNTTYIIINDTVSISSSIDNAMSSIDDIILRNVDSFSVFGNVTDNSVFLRGLVLSIVLLDSTYNDVTGSYLIGINSLRINNDGTFNFTNLQISLSCPQGEYSLNITFTGDIDDTGILLNNFTVHSYATIQINITAGTNIVQDSWYTDYDLTYPEYSDRWILFDTLHINGTLTWDNGSAISGMYINVTIVNLLDGTVVTFNASVTTDGSGFFDVSIYIDLYDNWPEYRVDSEIWVYFDPILSGVQYVEGSEQEYT